MAKTPQTFDLRGLAKERLRLLNEPSPEDIAREIAEAEAQGHKIYVLPGVRILVQKIGPEDDA